MLRMSKGFYVQKFDTKVWLHIYQGVTKRWYVSIDSRAHNQSALLPYVEPVSYASKKEAYEAEFNNWRNAVNEYTEAQKHFVHFGNHITTVNNLPFGYERITDKPRIFTILYSLKMRYQNVNEIFVNTINGEIRNIVMAEFMNNPRSHVFMVYQKRLTDARNVLATYYDIDVMNTRFKDYLSNVISA